MTLQLRYTIFFVVILGLLFLMAGFTSGTDSKKNSGFYLKEVIITIIYDNYSVNTELKSAWGFSCLVEEEQKTILFDTGGDGQILLFNMQKLGVEPAKINSIFLSHIHGDHTGGLDTILNLNSNIKVYLPCSFPQNFKRRIRKLGADVIEIKGPTKVCNHIYSTGEMGGWIKEQSLLMKTKKGVVIITGCAHPGVVNIIRKAKEITQNSIYLVLGGFHLSGAGEERIKRIIQQFREEGVKKVAPCHCSGDLARNLFRDIYKENFISVGVGKIVKIDNSGE